MSTTLILTNYRRFDDLNNLIQKFISHVHEIWVWDNSGDEIPKFLHAGVKWFSSPINMKCIPRWWLASSVETEFVCIMDDDLRVFSAETVLKQAQERCQAWNCVVGVDGKQLEMNTPYVSCPDVQGCYVDILKGQFWFLRPEWITDVPSSGTCDDIEMSALVSQPKFVDLAVRSQFDFLASTEYSLCRRSNHYDEREYYRRQYFET